MTVTGKVVDNRTLQGVLVALERPRSAQTCSQRPVSNVIWYLFLIKSTRAIIAVTLQRKPHLPHPSTSPPALFPGLRLGWCSMALSSALLILACAPPCLLFFASTSSLWGIKISSSFFLYMQIQNIQAYFGESVERVRYSAVAWELVQTGSSVAFDFYAAYLVTLISFYSYWDSITL